MCSIYLREIKWSVLYFITAKKAAHILNFKTEHPSHIWTKCLFSRRAHLMTCVFNVQKWIFDLSEREKETQIIMISTELKHMKKK